MFKALRRTLTGLVVLYLALWGLTLFIHYPNPVAAVQLGLAEPSQTGKLMPAAPIEASSPQPWDASAVENRPLEVEFQGRQTTLEQFLLDTRTNAFLVIKDGKVLREQYFNGNDESTQLPSYSVAKSVVSILAGQLIAEGKLQESDKFVDFFPEFRTGTAYDQITIAQLLDMASGVAVADNYPTGPEGWGAPIAQMYATTDINDFILNHRDLYWEPGTDHEYRSVDTQMVGMVIERIEGKNLAAVAQQRLWGPLGMEHNGTWNLDRDGGMAKGFCCLNISARDFAKLGLAYLNAATGDSYAQVSAAWAQRLATPVTKLDHGWGYGAFTWHPYPDVTMYLGLHGQFVFVHPDSRTIIVKLSDNKTDAMSEETVKVFRQVLEHYSGA